MKKETFDDIKEHIEERVSCLILSALILELIILVILVVFEYNKEDAIDFFYLYSVIFLILASIYFVWSSVVKENAFELPSFIVISTLLNTHAVIQVLNDGHLTFLHWLALVTFILSQIVYFICCPFAYQKYSWRMMNEIKSSNPRLMTGFKVQKHFVSISKLDFLLYCVISCIYLFAILIDWNSFHILGLILGFGSMVFIGLVSWTGIISVLNI